MRTRNSILNIITSVVFTFIVGILSMFRLKYFVGYYGNEVNGFFTLSNSISLMITFVEAGMGGIFIQKMYKLLAFDDKESIVNLFYTVKRIGMVITLFIFLLAFGYSFIHVNQYQYLFGPALTILVYWLYMLPTVISYYLRIPAYVLMADQKEYIVSFFGQLGNVISYLIQIILLLRFKNLNIIVISLVMFVFSLLPLVINYWIALHKYSYLRHKPAHVVFDKDVLVKMKDCLMASVSNSIMQSVDTIMLAYCSVQSNIFRLSLISVISIYNGVILLVKNILNGFVSQVIASFGNVMHTDRKNFNFLYSAYIKISFVICTAIFACVFGAINKFNLIFYNMGDKLLPFTFVLVIVVNAVLDVIKIPLIAAPVNINGDYKFQRNLMAFEAFANVLLSYVLLMTIGEIGLFLATLIVQLISVGIVLPIKCYQIIERKYKDFFKEFCFYALMFIFLCYVNVNLIEVITIRSIITLFIAAGLLACINISLLVFLSLLKYEDFRIVVDDLVTKLYRGVA